MQLYFLKAPVCNPKTARLPAILVIKPDEVNHRVDRFGNIGWRWRARAFWMRVEDAEQVHAERFNRFHCRQLFAGIHPKLHRAGQRIGNRQNDFDALPMPAKKPAGFLGRLAAHMAAHVFHAAGWNFKRGRGAHAASSHQNCQKANEGYGTAKLDIGAAVGKPVMRVDGQGGKGIDRACQQQPKLDGR